MRIIAMMLVALFVFMPTSASATDTNDTHKCYEAVIDREAYDETVVISEAWIETIPAVPGQWWNFSPNDNKGPFDGPPAFPTDERGTWNGPHANGGPSQDLTGTFQQGNGNGSWFHREPGTAEQTIEHPAVTETVHHEATYKQVEVPCSYDVTIEVEQRQTPYCDGDKAILMIEDRVRFNWHYETHTETSEWFEWNFLDYVVEDSDRCQTDVMPPVSVSPPEVAPVPTLGLPEPPRGHSESLSTTERVLPSVGTNMTRNSVAAALILLIVGAMLVVASPRRRLEKDKA